MKSIITFGLVLVLVIGLTTVMLVDSKTIYSVGINKDSIIHDGLSRTFHLYLPKNYDGKTTLPLVFVLHGGGGNADHIEEATGFSKLAEKEGFICVYPNGTSRLGDRLLTWNAGGDCCGYALDHNIDDVGFISTLIDHLTEHLAIDERRIYSCGFSNGAFMSYRVACEIPHKLAGVGIVAGALNCNCEPSEPISIIHIHGKDEKHVPYGGGIGEKAGVERVDKSVFFARDFWIECNGCSRTPDTHTINEVAIDSFGGGRLGADFKLISIKGFGHAWPGGNYIPATGVDPTCSINATEELWHFFEAHPKLTNPLEEIANWAYQIDDLSDEKLDRLAESSYDLLVVDRNGSLKGEENNNDVDDVSKLRKGRDDRIIIAYIDVGQAESYRKYWQDDWDIGNPEWIVGADPDGWDDNYCVKFWDNQWKNIMLAQFDELLKAGYDGAYLDWLEVYDYELLISIAEDEGVNLEDEITEFVRILASHCRKHNPGFLLIAQNASEMGRIPSYRNLFDGIAQEAIWLDGGGDPETSDAIADMSVDAQWTSELIKDLRVWQYFGLPVFNCEYAVDKSNEAYRLGKSHGFITYCTTRSLDELSTTPPDFKDYFRAVNINHEGELRPYYLYAPSGEGEIMPLVLMLHGGGGRALNVIQSSGFLDLYRQEEFAIAFPNGGLNSYLGERDMRTWHCGDCFSEVHGDDRDIEYIAKVIDSISERLSIDPDHVYVCGHSMGGMMSHRLACQLSDRLTGVASVAGPLVNSECLPFEPIPILHIHGTDDLTVPFNGGENLRGTCHYPDVSAMIDDIAVRNHNYSDPIERILSENVTSFFWDGFYPVELVVVDDHDHTWPNKQDHGFSASEYIWCFFSGIN
jgi:polyhydroxybutyrate depolymerase